MTGRLNAGTENDTRMPPVDSKRGSPVGAATRYSIALFVGLVAFLLLFPFAGSDTQPPTQWSVFGNRVPSAEPYLAVGVGLAAAGLVLVATSLVRRRRRATHPD